MDYCIISFLCIMIIYSNSIFHAIVLLHVDRAKFAIFNNNTQTFAQCSRMSNH